jgi:signal transduction histidine kinase
MVERDADDPAGVAASESEPAPAPAPIERLLEQLVERANEVIGAQDRLRRLLRANGAIISELSLDGVLRRIVEAARELAKAEYAALGVIGTDGSLERFIHIGMDDATVAAIGELPKGRGLLGALIADPAPIRLVSIRDDDRSSGFPPEHPPMDSFLGVPIRSRNQVYGNLYLSNQVDGAFSAEDQELVLALAATAGIAIENARLFEAAQRRQAWLEASADISAVLLAPQPTRDPLELIVQSMKRLAGADVVTVVRHAAEPGMLQVETAIGAGADHLRGLRYPADDSLVEVALKTGHGARADSVGAGEPYVAELQQAFDMGAVMAVPLSGNTGQRVALGLARVRGRPAFEPADLEMAEAFAKHATVAIELRKARTDQQRLAVLEDRDRIARDLHDHVIQRLFAAGLSLQSLASGADRPEHAQRLSRVVADLDETIRQVRSSIFELQSGPTRPGVRSAVLAVAEQLRPVLGFEPDVRFEGPVDTLVGDTVLGDVEAVVREAMTNVAKHARATAVQVTVAASSSSLSVNVRDDGIGIGEPGRASGLQNLRARASKHNGGLVVHSGESGGTELRWTAKLSS